MASRTRSWLEARPGADSLPRQRGRVERALAGARMEATFGCWRHRAAVGLLLSVAVLGGLFRLTAAPPLWWDEGYTLAVARNWVVLGHYGQLLDGEPMPPGLAASFPVVAPVALSFKLLGIGIWQARLVGVLWTLAGLLLVYSLARRLFDRRVAVGALLVLLFLCPEGARDGVNPLLMGRQVMGEMPMLVYLLAGYACFLRALDRRPWLLPLAAAVWGVALLAKAQLLPFWMFSLLVPLVVMLLRREWRLARWLGLALLGSLAAARLLAGLVDLLLRGHTLPGSPIPGLYGVTALVPALSVRLGALEAILLMGLPTLLGLGWMTRVYLRQGHAAVAATGPGLVRLALLALAASWFVWYAALSVGAYRYLFPATFVGSIFAAAALGHWSGGFSPAYLALHAGTALRRLRISAQSARALLVIVLLAVALPTTVLSAVLSYLVFPDESAAAVARFLNTRTAPGARIETSEAQLFFLLDRAYHYPPQDLHVQMIQRNIVGRDFPVDYDPLAADPDYLVIGGYQRDSRLYDPILEPIEVFRFLKAIGSYEIYERIR